MDNVWLIADPTDSFMPNNVQVSVDPSSLTTGTYTTAVTILTPNGSPTSTKVPVTVNILAPQPRPTLAVDSATLNIGGFQRGPDAFTRLKVLNTGPGSVNYTLAVKTATGGNWLSVSSSTGTATLSTPSVVTVSATPGTLSSGTYSGTITVSGTITPVVVNVTFTVAAPAASILVSQTGLGFTSVVKGTSPLPQNFGILNIGQGSMTWTASAKTISGGDWLKLASTSGTVQRAFLDVSLVDVSVDPSGLAAGTYYGKIDITAPANNTPSSQTVLFTVLPEGSILGPEVRPTGLIFTGLAGVNPTPKDIQIGTASGQTDSYVTRNFGQTYSYSPSSSAVSPNQATNMRVYPDFSALQPGSFERAGIAFQFTSDGSFRSVQVLTVVAPSGSFNAGIQQAANPHAGCSNSQLRVVFKQPTQSSSAGFQGVIGQPLTIEVEVSDACGGKVAPFGAANNVQVWVAPTNGDSSIQLTHIGDGVYRNTWKPIHNQSQVTLGVLANVFSAGQNGTVSLAGVLGTQSDTPAVTAGGVVQSASSVAGVPVAPGSLITIYGLNLANGTATASGIPLPSQLCGTQVRMGNSMLPILYCSAGQMNVQVPYDVPVDTQFQLSVQKSNLLSVPEYLAVAQAQPGIFTDNNQGTGQGKIYRGNGAEANPAAPAAIGETVVVYCSGLGQVSPAVEAGKPAPSLPLAQTVSEVTVQLGGKPAKVTFSGLTPGFSGLYQVNVEIPAGIATGDAVEVSVQVAGQTSPPVTMAVR